MSADNGEDLHKVYDEEPAAALYITVTFCMITGIASIFGLLKYWKKSNFPFVQKRHPVLVMITVICLICLLLIERPLSFFARLSQFGHPELQWTRWIIHIVLVPIQSACVFFRIYMTKYDVSFFKRNAKSAWVHYIDANSELDSKSQRAVSDHQSKGNIYKAYPYLLLIIILVIVVVIIASILDIAVAVLLNAVILIVFTLGMIVMWLRTPRYLDAFKIRSEIRRVLWLQLFEAIINIVYFVLSVTNADGTGVPYAQWLAVYCCSIVAIALLAMVQTWWVLYQMHSSQAQQRRLEQNGHLNTAPSSSDAEEDELVLNVDIIDVITNPIGFEAFMSHLAKEFSMENLLAIVEMTQYKKRFRYIRDVKDKLEAGEDPLESQQQMKITNIVLNLMQSLGSPGRSIVSDHDDAASESGSDLSTDAEAEPDTNAGMQANAHADADTENDGDIEMKQKQTKDINTSTAKLGSELISKSVTELRRSATAIDVNQQVLPLPEGLPLSTIVYGAKYNENDLRSDVQRIRKLDLKTHAIGIVRSLFLKYIVVGAELELNLSHRLRSRCLDKLSYLDEMDEIELEHMFDKCVAAVLKLMQDSYGRFKETHEFKKYEQKTKKKKKQNSTIRNSDLGGIFGDLM